MAKGTELIKGGRECQLLPLLSPLLLLPAVIWTEEKLVQSRLSRTQVCRVGSAQSQAGVSWGRRADGCKVQGFSARCWVLLAPIFFKISQALEFSYFPHPFKLETQKSALFGPTQSPGASGTHEIVPKRNSSWGLPGNTGSSRKPILIF